MTKKILSGGIYRESLRRIKIFAIIACALILCFQALPAITSAILGPCLTERTVIDCSSICLLLPVIAIVAPVILVMMLFSPFNKRPYSDFAHSLPYTRTCIFLTKTAALYTALIFFIALAVVAGIAAYSLFPSYYVLNFTGIWTYILKYVSVATFVTSSFQIAVALTGTVLSNFTAALLILFFPRFILTVITTAITSSNPFMGSGTFIPLLSTRYNTFVGLFTSVFSFEGYVADSMGPIIYTLAVSAVYLVIALIVFRKRKSETAEQPAPGRTVQAAIRILIALVFTVPATAFLISDGIYELDFAIVLYALGLVAYFAYELITTRSWKNLLRAIPALLIVVAVNVLVALTVFGVSFAASNYSPKANEIDSVSVQDGYYRSWDGMQYLPDGSGVELRDMKTKAIIADILSENVDAWKDQTYDKYYSSKYVQRNVFIKENCLTRSRTIYLTEEQEQALVSAISQNEDFIKAYMELPDALDGTMGTEYEIDHEYEDDILDAFRKEVKALGFEKWYSICTVGYDNYDANMFNLRYRPEGYTDAEVNVTLSSEVFPETFSQIIRAIYANADKEKIREAANILADKDNEDRIDYFDLNLTVTCGGKSYQYYYNVFGDGDINWLSADVVALIRDAAATGKEPDAKNCICLNLSIDYRDTDKPGDFTTYGIGCYLPVPDGFDPAGCEGLEEIFADAEYAR